VNVQLLVCLSFFLFILIISNYSSFLVVSFFLFISVQAPAAWAAVVAAWASACQAELHRSSRFCMFIGLVIPLHRRNLCRSQPESFVLLLLL
jgi:hypothetical protein